VKRMGEGREVGVCVGVMEVVVGVVFVVALVRKTEFEGSREDLSYQKKNPCQIQRDKNNPLCRGTCDNSHRLHLLHAQPPPYLSHLNNDPFPPYWLARITRVTGTDESGDPRSSEIDLDQHSAGKGSLCLTLGRTEKEERRGGGKDSLGDKMSMARVLRGGILRLVLWEGGEGGAFSEAAENS
jgi:hypothetical protein